MRRKRANERSVALVALATAAVALSPVVPSDGSGSAAASGLPVAEAVRTGAVRNVLLFIGDGMGDSEITLARNYDRGAAGRLTLDRLPVSGSYTTYSVGRGAPDQVEYVTDSAAAATGWATGSKTYNGAIGVDARGRPLPTVLELAQQGGYRTGNVTTAEVFDATPAAISAHVLERDCAGPDDMQPCAPNAVENGGPGSIVEQQVALRPDVLMGGGAEAFAQRVRAGEFAGRTVRQQAEDSGFQVLDRADQLDGLSGDRPVLGLFADGGLAPIWTGPVARRGGTEPTRCAPNAERPADEPRLAEMTRAAVDLLDRKSAGQQRGFFLQVESAGIDNAAHDAEPCAQIGETLQFDEAVAAGLEFAEHNPGTLVIVTADHAQATQIVPNGVPTPGQTATLITNEGSHITVNYATAMPGESQEHSGSQVPIAGQGPHAADVDGVTDQTDLFRTLTGAMGLG
ncbi:alkaline phosphatase [Saccharopolyspora hirsuta]|nr:alkaline phosphatase [Saccharopolyspora hirsuta]